MSCTWNTHHSDGLANDIPGSGSCFDKDSEHSGNYHGHEEYFRRVKTQN